MRVRGDLGRSRGARPRPLEVARRASDHLAQLCLHVGDFFGKDTYHQWIIFDDLWAGEHPDLAEGILRYAKRWDVLTS